MWFAAPEKLILHASKKVPPGAAKPLRVFEAYKLKVVHSNINNNIVSVLKVTYEECRLSTAISKVTGTNISDSSIVKHHMFSYS